MSEDLDEKTTLLAKCPRKNWKCVGEDGLPSCSSYSSLVSISEASEVHGIDDSRSEIGTSRRDWRLLLLEPMILVLLFAYNLSSTIIQHQILYQTCTAIFFYNDTDCKLLGTNNLSIHTKSIENEVQPYAARIFMTSSVIESIVPALCGAFIGSWSDRFGRKPLLVAAFAGYACYYIIVGVISHLATEHLVSPWYYILGIIPHSLLGGDVSYTVAAICFITDVTTIEERSYRLTYYEVALYTGLLIGTFSSGFIYEATNSTTVFAISAASILLALFVIIVFIPESLHLNAHRNLEENTSTPVGVLHAEIRQEGSISHQLFDLRHLKEMWMVCSKPRPYNDRSIVWLAVSVMLIASFVVVGSSKVFYLFVREQLHWSVKQFTTYETFSILVPIIGNIVGVWLLQKFLQYSVISLAIMAYVSHTLSSLMKGFAFTGLQLYLAIVAGALKSIGNPMCRTLITNIVPTNELGKIFAFISIIQTLLPFVAAPLYTIVYTITLISFPGFFNVLNANFFLIAIGLLLEILRRKQMFSEHYEAILI